MRDEKKQKQHALTTVSYMHVFTTRGPPTRSVWQPPTSVLGLKRNTAARSEVEDSPVSTLKMRSMGLSRRSPGSEVRVCTSACRATATVRRVARVLVLRIVFRLRQRGMEKIKKNYQVG